MSITEYWEYKFIKNELFFMKNVLYQLFFVTLHGIKDNNHCRHRLDVNNDNFGDTYF